MTIPIVHIIFWLAAAVAVAGGLGVVLSSRPIYSVLSLVLVMLSLAVLFLILGAQFVFAVQIIVYAGAVMVLFLFVVALLGPRPEPPDRLRFQWPLSILVVALFAGLLWAQLSGIRLRQPDHADLSAFGTVQDIARGLFTTYLYPFELTSLLLLTAAIGAIYLSRERSS